MRGSLVIASREILSALVTPLFYVVSSFFALLVGFFFFGLLSQFNVVLERAAMLPNVNPSLNEWVIQILLKTIEILLVFTIPLITMKFFSEEKRQGTYELLATSPVSMRAVAFGKFLAAAFLVETMLAIAFVFPVVLIILSDPEWKPIVTGFVGLSLFGLAFTSLGLAISSLSEQQTVAGFVSLVVFLLFYLVDSLASVSENLGDFIRAIAPGVRAEGFINGVLGLSDTFYFLSLIMLGLFFTARILEAHRSR
jgi:ABC-2 type transport system permease protein